MTVLPVIERELRMQARLGFTYLLRVLGATALLLVCLYFGGSHGFSPKFGGKLFGYLNCTLFVSIWVLVPLLAADCISRERREGTLGLLFLTPLKAREIVLAKGFVHGTRALTLWLAVLPILTLSFLLGGITWKEAVLSVFTNFSSICWALAAGLLASSSSKTWLRALLLAGGIAVCFSVAFIVLNGSGILAAIGHDSGFHLPYPYQNPGWQSRADWLQEVLPTGFFGVTDIDGWWGGMFGSLTRPSQKSWLMAEVKIVFISILMLLAVILIAAWNLRRLWQEEPPSARRVWLQKKFFTPVVGVSFFKRWIRRKLERNPIGWLEQRSWSGRLVTWGWLAVMVSFYSAIFYAPNINQILAGVQNFMAWCLLGVMAVSAAGSFQRERESRVLELLLVSPMNESDIIGGRLRGLWGQFLPALLLMLAVWIYLAALIRQQGSFSLVPFFCAGFLSLPVIGLYYSLRRVNFISAFFSTLLAGLLLPQFVKVLLDFGTQVFLGFGLSYLSDYLWPDDPSTPLTWLYAALLKFLVSPFFVAFIQIGIAFWYGRKLHRDLVQRNFAFSKAAL